MEDSEKRFIVAAGTRILYFDSETHEYRGAEIPETGVVDVNGILFASSSHPDESFLHPTHKPITHTGRTTKN